MSDDIYSLYNIDKTKLKRDYIKYPIKLTKNGKGSESPSKEELEYLYIDLNIKLDDLYKFFGVNIWNVSRWLSIYGIKKDYKNISKNIIQTNYERYGCVSSAMLQEYKDKIRNTCIERYGCDYVVQTDEFKNKAKQTKIEKYGDENYSNHEQARITWRKTYNENKEDILNRTIETNRKRYGCDFYSQSEEHLLNVRKKKKESLKKAYETKKENGTLGFNASKQEKQCFDMLKRVYPDAISQYFGDSRYPYNCDMYIPSLDLFIEFQGYQGGHYLYPYRDNDEDKKILEEMKLKSIKNGKKNNIYDRIVNVWGNKDIIKRQIAKTNNIRLLEFFSVKEFSKWLNETKNIDTIENKV